MGTRRLITSLIGLLTILTIGCEFHSEGGLNPNAPSQIASMLVGTWTTASADSGSVPSSSFPDAASCTDLEWRVTQQDGSNYSGEFSATCSGDIQLTGTATGTLVDDVLAINASGTATLPAVASCPFTLNGTARLDGQVIRIEYTGNTCVGSISGTELLERS